MRQVEEEPKVKQQFRKQTEWSIERLKDTLIPTKKFEDTEECKRWREALCKQRETTSGRKLCAEIEAEVLESMMREKAKEEPTKAEEMRLNWITIEVDYHQVQ